MTKKHDLSKSDFNLPLIPNEFEILLSSPVLMLAKGKQKIRLTINLTKPSYKQSKGNLKQWKLRKTSDAFQLYITDDHGWHQIDRFKAKFDDKKQALILSFHLMENYEYLVPFDNIIHEGNIESDWPCIKILLNNHAVIHPCKFLEKLVITNIIIKTEVAGVTDLNLSNSVGELDSSIPFTPFGPVPYHRSYLRIDNQLVLQKNLTSLTLSLNWNGLPRGSNGFKDHYLEYPFGIDNNSFKAVINQSRNRHKEIDEAFELFDVKSNSNKLSNLKKKKVNLEKLDYKNQISLTKDTISERSTPLYIILTQPEMGFGHHIFSQLYAEAVMKKSKLKSRFWKISKKEINLPKQPYTPIIDKLSVDYTNVAKAILF